MDSFKALAILAFIASVNGAALPQLPFGVATATTASAGPATGSAAIGVIIAKPTLPAVLSVALPAVGGISPSVLPSVPSVPAVSSVPAVPAAPSVPAALSVPAAPALPGVPPVPTVPAASGLPSVPAVPVVSGLSSVPAVPVVSGLPFVPAVPLVSGLPSVPAVSVVPGVPAAPAVSAAGLPDIKALPFPGLWPFPLPVPKLPGVDGLPIPKVPGIDGLPVPVLPGGVPKLPDARSLPVALPGPPNGDDAAAALSHVVALGTTVLNVILSILSKGASLIPLPGGLPIPSAPLLNASLPLTKRQPQLNGILGGAAPKVSATSPAAPLAAVGGLTGSIAPASGGTGSVPALGAIGSIPAVGAIPTPVPTAVVGAVSGATASVSVVSPAASSVASTASNLYPAPFTGIPNTDPVGAFSISVIATLLSLLKKDPMALFAPSLPVAALVKRDLPHLHQRDIPELAKRQLPSLSAGIPGVGVGGLPLSGVTGVSPDLTSLVGSIAKNIAVPGGTGLGSITSNILGVLNGVVPNFLFQLPVVQDAVPTFGVLQLLSSINPTKFGGLGGLTNLASLSSAASGIPAGDLAFIKSLPTSPDPTNLVTTIMTLSDNILSLPGNVANLKASVAVLCLKNLGLAVPGL